MKQVHKRITKITLLLLILIGVIYEIDNPLWQHIADHRWMATYIHQGGWLATVGVLIFGAVFTGMGGPRQLMAAMFGYVFGAFLGIAASLFCSLVGASCAYMLARFVLQRGLRKRFASKLDKFSRLVDYQPFVKILVLRLLPVGSNVITNLLSGTIRVRFLPFICGSGLGYLPQTIIFALAGSGVGKANQYQLSIGIALAMISIVLSGWLYKSHLQHQVSTVIKD